MKYNFPKFSIEVNGLSKNMKSEHMHPAVDQIRCFIEVVANHLVRHVRQVSKH